MTILRRTFLRDALRTTLSAGLLLTAARAGFSQQDGWIPLEAQQNPVFRFALSTFEPFVGDIFEGRNSRGESVEMKLVEVKKYEAINQLTKLARKTNSFSIQFRASEELPPFTSIHTINHPRLGKFDLFLTLRKTENNELFYEAVFSHVQ